MGLPLLAKLPIEQVVNPTEERTFAIQRERIHLFDLETEQAVATAAA